MAHLRTRPHPVLIFLACLIFGPYLLAAAALIGALALTAFLLDALVWLISGRRITTAGPSRSR